MTPSSLHEERKGRGFFSDLEVNFLVLTGTDSPVCRVQTPDTTRAGRHDVRSRGSQGGRGVAATRRARSRAAVPGRRAPHRQHIAAPRRGLQPSSPRVHLRAVPQRPQRHHPPPMHTQAVTDMYVLATQPGPTTSHSSRREGGRTECNLPRDHFYEVGNRRGILFLSDKPGRCPFFSTIY